MYTVCLLFLFSTVLLFNFTDVCDIIPTKKGDKQMNPVVGGLCTTFTFLPQTIKSIRTRNVSGLSWMTYTIYCIGCALWILYGIYLKSLQIILFDGIALLFGSIILYLIVTNKKSKK